MASLAHDIGLPFHIPKLVERSLDKWLKTEDIRPVPALFYLIIAK